MLFFDGFVNLLRQCGEELNSRHSGYEENTYEEDYARFWDTTGGN